MIRWRFYVILLQSTRKMLYSLGTDLVVFKAQCRQCLYETKGMRDKMSRQGCYFILLKSIAKILCSLGTDLIVSEVQYGECLCGTT
jgi:predicted Zn-ribbon and HTH transcriptional regulator